MGAPQPKIETQDRIGLCAGTLPPRRYGIKVGMVGTVYWILLSLVLEVFLHCSQHVPTRGRHQRVCIDAAPCWSEFGTVHFFKNLL